MDKEKSFLKSSYSIIGIVKRGVLWRKSQQ